MSWREVVLIGGPSSRRRVLLGRDMAEYRVPILVPVGATMFGPSPSAPVPMSFARYRLMGDMGLYVGRG